MKNGMKPDHTYAWVKSRVSEDPRILICMLATKQNKGNRISAD